MPQPQRDLADVAGGLENGQGTCVSIMSCTILATQRCNGLLNEGITCTVIALWLGHESAETTQVYLHADLRIKEKAWKRPVPSGSHPGGSSRPIPCWPS